MVSEWQQLFSYEEVILNSLLRSENAKPQYIIGIYVKAPATTFIAEASLLKHWQSRSLRAQCSALCSPGFTKYF